MSVGMWLVSDVEGGHRVRVRTPPLRRGPPTAADRDGGPALVRAAAAGVRRTRTDLRRPGRRTVRTRSRGDAVRRGWRDRNRGQVREHHTTTAVPTTRRRYARGAARGTGQPDARQGALRRGARP